MSFARKWAQLERIMLNKVSLRKANITHFLSLVGPILYKYTNSLCADDIEGEIRHLVKQRGLMGKGEG